MLHSVVTADADPGVRQRVEILQRRRQSVDPGDQIGVAERNTGRVNCNGVGIDAGRSVKPVDSLHGG